MRPRPWYLVALSVLAWMVWAALVADAGTLVLRLVPASPQWLPGALAAVAELAVIVVSVVLARGRLHPPVAAIWILMLMGLVGVWSQLYVGAAILVDRSLGDVLGSATRQGSPLPTTIPELMLGILRAEGPFLFGSVGLLYLRNGSLAFQLTSRRLWLARAAAVVAVLVAVGAAWAGARTGFLFAGTLDERTVPAGQRIELDGGHGAVTVPAGWQATVTRNRDYPAWTMRSDIDWQGQDVLLRPVKHDKTGAPYLMVAVAREASFWKRTFEPSRDGSSTPLQLPPGLLGGAISESASSSITYGPERASLRVVLPDAGRPAAYLLVMVPKSEASSLEPDRLAQTLAPFRLQLNVQ